MKTISILIGNSDNKLTQQEWACFVYELKTEVKKCTNYNKHSIYFSGCSNPDDEFQNFCAVFSFDEDDEFYDLHYLKQKLEIMRKFYRQDSIALVIGETELLGTTEI